MNSKSPGWMFVTGLATGLAMSSVVGARLLSKSFENADPLKGLVSHSQELKIDEEYEKKPET